MIIVEKEELENRGWTKIFLRTEEKIKWKIIWNTKLSFIAYVCDVLLCFENDVVNFLEMHGRKVGKWHQWIQMASKMFRISGHSRKSTALRRIRKLLRQVELRHDMTRLVWHSFEISYHLWIIFAVTLYPPAFLASSNIYEIPLTLWQTAPIHLDGKQIEPKRFDIRDDGRIEIPEREVREEDARRWKGFLIAWEFIESPGDYSSKTKQKMRAWLMSSKITASSWPSLLGAILARRNQSKQVKSSLSRAFGLINTRKKLKKWVGKKDFHSYD